MTNSDEKSDEDIQISDTDDVFQKINDNQKKLMNTLFTYPEPDDPDFQIKMYEKKEFYNNKIPERPEFKTYEDIKEYRDNIGCGFLNGKPTKLHPYQTLLTNFIHPSTPFKGLIVMHGLGSGKTRTGVSIAENFIPQCIKYRQKIIILVPGPLLKESWKKELLMSTGEKYLKYMDKSIVVSKEDKDKINKNAMAIIFQYYKFMSYKSFYKHVLGEKIIDKRVIENTTKTKNVYRKNDAGEFERDLSADRIYNLNNSLLIIDEAHQLTNNSYGEAVKYIIDNSINLKVVLLTATPMKNLATDIVQLVNFLRPKNNQMERDMIFTSEKNHTMKFKPGGEEYLRNMCSGYFSYVRGADPLTYATRNDQGVIPNGLLFTKVVQCKMSTFQQNVYNLTIDDQIKEINELENDTEEHDDEKRDTLDRKSEAVSNFVFPGLSNDKKEIVGYFGREGINTIRNQLKENASLLNKKLSTFLYGNENETDILYMSTDNKTITGKIYKKENLQKFSTKFYQALLNIEQLVWGKQGVKTAFVYSNLVKVGIEIFQEILLQNGYLEYQEDKQNYQITPDTVCYYCGLTYGEHQQMAREKAYGRVSEKSNSSVSEKSNSSVSEKSNSSVSEKSNSSVSEKSNSSVSEKSHNSSNKIYNNVSKSPMQLDLNSDISDDDDSSNVTMSTNSISLDSSVSSIDSNSSVTSNNMMVGGEIKNIPIHKFYPATFITVTGKSSDDTVEVIPEEKKAILDNVFNNIKNKDGRDIKFVLGSKVMNEGISLWYVGDVHILDVYYNLGKVDQAVGRAIRYCSHYKLMNENNPFPEVKVYKYVVTLENKLSTEEELYKKAELKYLLIKKVERHIKEVAIDCATNLNGNIFKEEIEKHKDCEKKEGYKCPKDCDFMNCEFKCANKKLNFKYYDPERKIYKKIAKDGLDHTTFNQELARNEIDYAKDKIKDMYITKFSYTIDEIIKYVYDSYTDEKRELFDDFYVFKALDELIPITENDANNFNDTIIDKHNRAGCLIYRGEHYIFQPFEQNENVPMYYRTTVDKKMSVNLSIFNYLKMTNQLQQYVDIKTSKTSDLETQSLYDFDSVMEYYDNRNEYDFVGFIDKELNKRKNKSIDEINDVFKLREKRAKILEKKRATGLPSLKGAVCVNARSKEYLSKVADKLGVDIKNLTTRESICKRIEDKMLYLEKYSTEKDKNKMTYVMIPHNHPKLPFPYNLEDRTEYIIAQLNKDIKVNIDISKKMIKDTNKKTKEETVSYIITINIRDKITDKVMIENINEIIKRHGGVKKDNTWIITVA
jgi:hypothetical protein